MGVIGMEALNGSNAHFLPKISPGAVGQKLCLERSSKSHYQQIEPLFNCIHICILYKITDVSVCPLAQMSHKDREKDLQLHPSGDATG